VEIVISTRITGQHSRPQFHLPSLGSLASWRTWRHLVANVGTSKRWGNQWQTTPKNLLRMQRTIAITSRLTELWSLPRPTQGLNTYSNNNNTVTVKNFPVFKKIWQSPLYWHWLSVTTAGPLWPPATRRVSSSQHIPILYYPTVPYKRPFKLLAHYTLFQHVFNRL